MSGESEAIRVMLVDDHTLFRGGLKTLLGIGHDFTVVAEASNGREFLDIVEDASPDVVLLDIDMPVMDGTEAARLALEANPDLRIIALSMHGQAEYYLRMVEIGVRGFLLKDSDFSEVATAIHAVTEGGSYFSKDLIGSISAELRRSPASENTAEPLSERELDVLSLICQGLSNSEIGERLFISKRTVDNHRANILLKTGCRNTAALVVYAIKHSLVEM